MKVLLGGGATFSMWALVGEVGHWGHALEGDLGTLVLSSLSFCFLAPMR